jgi:hypothetical protein
VIDTGLPEFGPGEQQNSGWRQGLILPFSTASNGSAEVRRKARLGWSPQGYGPAVPVEFLTAEQAEAYGKFTEEPTRPELERFFYLDDVDRALIGKRRGD